MCSPCGPMVCYKYEDCGPAKGKSQEGQASRAEEGGEQKKDEKENQLKRTKSRELRGGIMYYSCHCIKRNGLQHDCRRTGCGGEPACLVLPDPVCAPSQLARARGLADPAPFAAHYAAVGGGSSGGQAAGGSQSSGKRFIVCELKGVVPDAGGSRGEKCCKCSCPATRDHDKHSQPGAASGACFLANVPVQPKASANTSISRCPCKSGKAAADSHSDGQSPAFVFDEKTLDTILKRFEDKELAESSDKPVAGPGGRVRKPKPPVLEKPCTRPGCVHWQPPPPCVWDLPCKADCFETPAGIQPGRNPLKSGGGGWISKEGESSVALGSPNKAPSGQHHNKMKLLTPECCTGCSGAGGGGASASASGLPAGLPVLVMKLC
ncbi:uncharacterized protein LOC134755914 isoform X1 [Cydia strobilella]|uniref:uncharacterized protein LOC134755914 isoform X1 n=1 Tax=Cydia strobilella TaxID=1100964 RepID=UPI0030043BC3